MKFHENPSSKRQVAPCEQTDGRIDMTMLTVAFRNIANAPKMKELEMGYRTGWKDGKFIPTYHHPNPFHTHTQWTNLSN